MTMPPAPPTPVPPTPGGGLTPGTTGILGGLGITVTAEDLALLQGGNQGPLTPARKARSALDAALQGLHITLSDKDLADFEQGLLREYGLRSFTKEFEGSWPDYVKSLAQPSAIGPPAAGGVPQGIGPSPLADALQQFRDQQTAETEAKAKAKTEAGAFALAQKTADKKTQLEQGELKDALANLKERYPGNKNVIGLLGDELLAAWHAANDQQRQDFANLPPELRNLDIFPAPSEIPLAHFASGLDMGKFAADHGLGNQWQDGMLKGAFDMNIADPLRAAAKTPQDKLAAENQIAHLQGMMPGLRQQFDSAQRDNPTLTATDFFTATPVGPTGGAGPAAGGAGGGVGADLIGQVLRDQAEAKRVQAGGSPVADLGAPGAYGPRATTISGNFVTDVKTLSDSNLLPVDIARILRSKYPGTTEEDVATVYSGAGGAQRGEFIARQQADARQRQVQTEQAGLLQRARAAGVPENQLQPYIGVNLDTPLDITRGPDGRLLRPGGQTLGQSLVAMTEQARSAEVYARRNAEMAQSVASALPADFEAALKSLSAEAKTPNPYGSVNFAELDPENQAQVMRAGRIREPGYADYLRTQGSALSAKYVGQFAGGFAQTLPQFLEQETSSDQFRQGFTGFTRAKTLATLDRPQSDPRFASTLTSLLTGYAAKANDKARSDYMRTHQFLDPAQTAAALSAYRPPAMPDRDTLLTDNAKEIQATYQEFQNRTSGTGGGTAGYSGAQTQQAIDQGFL